MLFLFRLCQKGRDRVGRFAYPVSAIYRTYSALLTGAELPVQTVVGRRLTIHHGVGLVVNGRTRIGDNVVLRQNTTLGSRSDGGDCPIIGDRVDIGAGSLVLGGIELGAECRVGAGAIVVHDVKAGATVIPLATSVRVI